MSAATTTSGGRVWAASAARSPGSHRVPWWATTTATTVGRSAGGLGEGGGVVIGSFFDQRLVDKLTAVIAPKIVGAADAPSAIAGRGVAEATPVDTNERWWVWKCPTAACPGLLHVAGYAVEKHALFVVCDGTCAKTFLR